MAIFGPKPWVNPFGKRSIFRLFELLVFIGQKGVFSFQNIAKDISHGFAPKLAIFPIFFLQVIQARKMSFTIFQNEKTPFQAIKTTSSKSRKIDIFPKGLTHGFGRKMAISPTCFFYAIQARKKSFSIFQNDKTPRQAIKIRSSKS